MKTSITISLTKEEAIYLTKILWRYTCDDDDPNPKSGSLLDEFVDLLDVKPWDL
mgnify:CR=1 FL=1